MKRLLLLAIFVGMVSHCVGQQAPARFSFLIEKLNLLNTLNVRDSLRIPYKDTIFSLMRMKAKSRTHVLLTEEVYYGALINYYIEYKFHFSKKYELYDLAVIQNKLIGKDTVVLQGDKYSLGFTNTSGRKYLVVVCESKYNNTPYRNVTDTLKSAAAYRNIKSGPYRLLCWPH